MHVLNGVVFAGKDEICDPDNIVAYDYYQNYYIYYTTLGDIFTDRHIKSVPNALDIYLVAPHIYVLVFWDRLEIHTYDSETYSVIWLALQPDFKLFKIKGVHRFCYLNDGALYNYNKRFEIPEHKCILQITLYEDLRMRLVYMGKDNKVYISNDGKVDEGWRVTKFRDEDNVEVYLDKVCNSIFMYFKDTGCVHFISANDKYLNSNVKFVTNGHTWIIYYPDRSILYCDWGYPVPDEATLFRSGHNISWKQVKSARL